MDDNQARPAAPDQPHQAGQPGQAGGWQQPAVPQPGFPQQGVPQPGAPYGSPPQQPVAPKGKRKVLITVLGVLVVCAGLCGAGQLITNILNQDDWEDLGQPVPASSLPATPTPTWKRPNMFDQNAKADPQIRYELEKWVLASAGVQKPMTSTCDSERFSAEVAATFDCTVTYAGQAVVFKVSTKPKGNGVFEWEAEAEQTVITREGLQAHVHRRYGGADWSNLRCDELPEVALVPVNQALSQFCYAKNKDAQKTSRIKITPSDQSEPILVTETQEEGLR